MQGIVFAKRKEAALDPTVSKAVFTDAPISPLTAGRWFEVRLWHVNSGFLTSCAMGFTQFKPPETEEEDDASRLAREEEGVPFDCKLPPKARDIPKTWLVGYNGKACADGHSAAIDLHLNVKILPLTLDTLGCLLTPAGHIVMYVNRLEVARVDFGGLGLPQIDTSAELFGVVDLTGGPQTVELEESFPPTEGEVAERQALQAKKDARRSPAKKKKDAAEGAHVEQKQDAPHAENADLSEG